MRKQVYAAEFKVLVDKTDGQMLGLTLSSQRDRGYLKIKRVKSSGLVQQWNDDHPDLAVQPGDRIVEVNSIRNDGHQMREEIGKDQILELVVKRKRGQA